jgi:hypothetical protein
MRTRVEVIAVATIVAAVTSSLASSDWAKAAPAGGFADRPAMPITDPTFDPPVVDAGSGPVRAPAQKTLFLNFDGALLDWCGEGIDDPHDNCSTIYQGVILPYSGDASARAAVVQAVRNDLRDFDVVVTSVRPPDEVDYDMEMIGDWLPSPGGGFAGIAPKIDCRDTDGGDVSFTLDISEYPQDIAKVILQEVAHTWGLEHVDAPGDLLYPTTGGAGNPVFTDQCSRIVALGGGGLLEFDARCPEQHADHCGDPHFQNAYQDILTLFGPAVPDTTPPQLVVLSPADGEHVPNDFHLVLEIGDDVTPQIFPTTIEITGLSTSDVQLAGPGVFPMAVNDLADGVWPIRISVSDAAGNVTEAEITVEVGAGEAPGETGTGGDTGSVDGTGSSGTDDGAASGGEQGCGCGSMPRRGGWMLVMLAFGLQRRRDR